MLRIRPEAGACSLSDEGSVKSEIVGQNIVCTDGSCEAGCECRATVDSDEGVQMVGNPIEEGCVCPVFRNHDCVASIETVDYGELVVALSLASRQVLTTIVEELRERGANVELRSISGENRSTVNRQLTLDVRSITDKQREAVEVAIESGYYDTPRKADLGELADRLGVSRSAVSQRLTAAEATLIEALYDFEAEMNNGSVP